MNEGLKRKTKILYDLDMCERKRSAEQK